MNTYYVQYHSRTSAALAARDRQQTLPLDRWDFNFLSNAVRVGMTDSVKRIGDINLHTGLNMIVNISADSVEGAGKRSKDFTEGLLNLVSFSTQTACTVAKLISIIDATGKNGFPARYYADPQERIVTLDSLVVIDEAQFEVVFETYHKSPYQKRLAVPLDWLRKGIGEVNIIVEFISYWIGLELIKDVVKKKFHGQMVSSNKDIPRKWLGVNHIFTTKLNFCGFDAIIRARNDIAHGPRGRDRASYMGRAFVEKVSTYLEPLRKTLAFCIGSILELDDNLIMKIASKPRRRVPRQPWTVLEGTLKGTPSNFGELLRDYPSIDVQEKDVQCSLDEGGDLVVSLKPSYTFHLPSGSTFGAKRVQFWR